MLKKVQDPDSVSDLSQNLTIFFLVPERTFLENCFLSYVGHGQTDEQTNKPQKKHYLLGRSNNCVRLKQHAYNRFVVVWLVF